MYNETEKKKLSKAAIKLLRKSIQDIKKDGTNTASTLLKLSHFVRIVFNDNERCKNLMVLIMAGMWNMFDKEVRR